MGIILLPQERWKVKGGKRLPNLRKSKVFPAPGDTGCISSPVWDLGLGGSLGGCPSSSWASSDQQRGTTWVPCFGEKAKCNQLAHCLGGQKIQTLQPFRKPEETQNSGTGSPGTFGGHGVPTPSPRGHGREKSAPREKWKCM